MANVTPLAAKENTAAKLMDMSVEEFRAAVEAGALPAARDIAGKMRWDTELLRKIIRGDFADGWDDIQW